MAAAERRSLFGGLGVSGLGGVGILGFKVLGL